MDSFVLYILGPGGGAGGRVVYLGEENTSHIYELRHGSVRRGGMEIFGEHLFGT